MTEHYYVATANSNAVDKGTGGSASRPGCSAAKPWKTVDYAISVLNAKFRKNSGVLQPTVLHIGPGTYRCSKTLGPFHLAASLYIIGDGFVELMTATATSGSASSVVGGTMTADQFRGKTIEILSGAAKNDRRTIRNNTIDTIVPCAQFSAAVTSGDTFRIVEPAVELQVPGYVGSITDPPMPVVSGVGERGALQEAWKNASPGFSLYMINVRCAQEPTATFGVGLWSFYGSSIVLVGVELMECASQFLAFQACTRSNVLAGIDLIVSGRRVTQPAATGLAPSSTAWTGWGLGVPTGSTPVIGISYFCGYIVSYNTDLAGQWWILGGSWKETPTAPAHAMTIRGGVITLGEWLQASTAIPVLITHAVSNVKLAALFVAGGGRVNVAYATIEKTNAGMGVAAVGADDHQGTAPGVVSLAGDGGLVNIVGITGSEPPSYGLAVRGGGRINYMDTYVGISGSFPATQQTAAFSARFDQGAPDAQQDFSAYAADGASIVSNDGSRIQRH